ncbi:MAG: hypothetical protein IIC53_12920 [Proteobacteria bacterium]|nr:hypothetical protein [Pseudomonadota bacterium]
MDGCTLSLSDSHVTQDLFTNIAVNNGTATIVDSEIDNSVTGIFQGAGTLTVSGSSVHDHTSDGIRSQSSSPSVALTVNNTDFQNNSNAMLLSPSIDLSHIGNTATNNNINGIVMNGNTLADRTWTKDTIPYVIFSTPATSTVVVTPGTTLTIDPGAEELGRVYQAEMLINAGMAEFAAAAKALAPVEARAWSGSAAEAHRHYLDTLQAQPIPGELQMGEVMDHLNATLPPETIVTNGAGNYAAWPNRFYKYRGYPSQLGPTSGSMGYGLPAAIAAKLVHPERPVVAFAGDGCFLMTGQELATAVSLQLDIVVLVVNNGMYGTIRMHQERAYPGRVLGTDLVNPDFAALARAYGARGETVERTEDFAPAFARALGAGGPTLIDLRIDPEAVTPKASLTQIREAAMKAQAGSGN